MSALANVLILTQRFMTTKDPVDYMAWSNAYELMTKEEENQVGGGIYLFSDA